MVVVAVVVVVENLGVVVSLDVEWVRVEILMRLLVGWTGDAAPCF